ncbi:AraC family transcriptional regulator [Vallitaleaceae bacterium 9-2]
MDCICSIQQAIEYMETHMMEKITYEDVAQHLYMSNYHFHRLFSMITGMTANEYIRNRKLSMAGQELVLSENKVIDIAFKYGYETPESFTKAFSRFHGVTPSVAKRSGTHLQIFNRLIIKIQTEGGTIMEYKIVEKEKFNLLVKVEKFDNEIVGEEENTLIPDFWKRCNADDTFDVLKAHRVNGDVYGACAPLSKEETHFEYGIGSLYAGGEVPSGFDVWEVKANQWAVFQCIGTDGQCIGETWDRIYKEFLPGSGYNMLDDIDFELYPTENAAECFCEIWIPVQKKD